LSEVKENIMSRFKNQLLGFIIISVLLVLFVQLFGCGPAPVPVPATISLQSGNGQTAPARGTLPKDIITTLSEASGLASGDTGDILIEYVIIKGGGSVSEPMATVRMPDVLGHRVQWTLGGFGENELQIKATWVASSNAVGGSPITVKAQTETVSDVDKNTYNIVRIGDQDWMVGNLKTTRYNDGTPIKKVTDSIEWTGLTTDAYCWYENNEVYKDPYGALYNQYAATNSKLCPKGWHVGTEDDWSTLIDTAGGLNVAGTKLKESGTAHWVHNPTATNELLFTVVGNGQRDVSYGSFGNIDINGGCWSSTINGSNEGIGFGFTITVDEVEKGPSKRIRGSGVRCMRDSL
jgi:uncharacterized protein (TIGR02145 family)